MKFSTIVFQLALLCAVVLSPSAAGSGYSSPEGIWDVPGRARVTVRFPDNQVKSAVGVAAFSFIAFYGDGRYNQINSSLAPGSWTASTGRNKAYAVSFDPAQIDANRANPPFLRVSIAKFGDFAKQRYGKVPAISRIEILAFRDTGRLIRGGLGIRGSNKTSLNVYYADPVSKQPVASRVTMALAYTGSRASAPSECCQSADPAQNQLLANDFLARNANLAGVRKTTSGLQYRVLRAGSGSRPKPASRVSVSYRGMLPSGQVFDFPDQPVTFDLENVVSGFSEGVRLMRVGAYYRLFIPPELAYGNRSVGSVIKPNSALIFDVVLSKIE
jgi:FKBP-type peptidyl-prolyl cis-trans isomerase